MELNFTESKTRWLKFGNVKDICFVGREYICISGGCHMFFQNVNTKDETVYRANNKIKGDGVRCVAGHKTIPVFAFAEKCYEPRIFVFTCPDFQSVCTLSDGSQEGYLAITFSEAEFLITLGQLPLFYITVWNWRIGEKIMDKKTYDIICEMQTLKCNFGSPVYMAQLGNNTDRLNVWDVFMCGKRCLITPHVISSPPNSGPFTSILWTSEGSLFALNTKGDTYMMNADYHLDLVLKWEEPGDKATFFTWFKAGLLIAGPNGAMKHYKKSGNWVCDWELKPDVAMVRLLNSPRDYLVTITELGDVMLFDPLDETFKCIRIHESRINAFCLIYPVGEFIVTLTHNAQITVWEVATGNMIDTMELDGTVLALKENPEYPYFAVAFAHGIIQLFSFYNGKTIELITTFHLTANRLNSIRFTEAGRIFVAADLNIGEFFVIEGVPGTRMHVVATCIAHHQIADYILVASKTCFRLFAIKVTSNIYIAGNIIKRFCIIRNRPCPDVKDYELEDPIVLYSKLYDTLEVNRDRVFFAISVTSKSIHELEVKRGDPYARLINRIPTGHHMRKMRFTFDSHHTVSCAYDGLVIVRSKEYETMALIMPHHRVDGGIEIAYADPLGKYVISLGRSNILVCTELTRVEIDTEKQEQLKEALNSETMAVMFTLPTTGFLPQGACKGKTWLEVQELKIFEVEREKCEKERHSILKKFKEIRKSLQRLLTMNLEGPENEILDVQKFNLDTDLMEEMMLASQRKCKETKVHLEALIVAQTKIAKWVKEYCWDTMNLQGKSICGIFGNFEVENYVLLRPDAEQQEIAKYIEEHRAVEEMMANDEIFEPWVPKTRSQMKMHRAKCPKLQEVVEAVSYDEDYADEEPIEEAEEEPDDKNDKETLSAFAGSLVHTYVKLNPGHYKQHDIQTFMQTEYQTILSRIENYKVKEYFNKEFEFLMSMKVREINNVFERNARLRHIISELNFFIKDKVGIIIIDPEWEQKEDPPKLLKVADNEVGITPYISPSEQAILDAEAAEAERIRLLLLADDFKEKALIVMMNGVLEIRWEDELKKDVPLPKCMIDKNPEDFNVEDLLTVKEYEEQVEFLHSERERYKRMLIQEYMNLGATLREGVKKFNGRLEDLLVLKIKVDSAIEQENLKINRLRLRNYKRMVMNNIESDIQKAIATNEKNMEDLQKKITSLYENLHESKSQIEVIQTKDKILEKNFRRDFFEASPAAQEIAQKLYKKRPKSNIRAITLISILMELAKCTVTQERTLILNQDSLDFLKAMDTLDLYIGVPNAIDEHAYGNLCKHRRLRVESEIKLKAVMLEIAEAEGTISILHKTLTLKKELNQKLTADLAQIRNEKIKKAQNIEIQLVLKQGLVEILTVGEIRDYNDAIMIARKDVEKINKIIIKNGNRKLKAMRDTMNFRRGIIAMEWEHKRKRMIIEDLEDYISDIHNVKVTKETQAYLKANSRGDSGDKELTFEQEVDLVKKSFQRIIDERKVGTKELQIRINSVKKDNAVLDKNIADINVDVCECKLNIDEKILKKERDIINARMAALLKRAKLVKQLQENHNEILVLQTELELLRLRTFPTLKYKVV